MSDPSKVDPPCPPPNCEHDGECFNQGDPACVFIPETGMWTVHTCRNGKWVQNEPPELCEPPIDDASDRPPTRSKKKAKYESCHYPDCCKVCMPNADGIYTVHISQDGTWVEVQPVELCEPLKGKNCDGPKQS